MHGIRHPFNRDALYERDGEGGILITIGDKTGRFRRDGSWIEGEITEADPQLCNWVAGPLVANHRVGSQATQDSHRSEDG